VYDVTVSADRGGAPNPDHDDHEHNLVARARSGDVAAYEELVRMYQGIATRVARMVAGADAEDVAQEAFVRAHNALGGFREGAPFRPWLLRIVVNLGHNAVRARGRQERVIARVPAASPASGADDTVILNDERRRLLDALRTLPERDRTVLTCRYLEGLSEAETGAVLGCRIGTVKSRTSRALDRLRAVIDQGATDG
jgi:RNA polymerase sigma-70 factor (ECF subfamily)